VAAAIRSETRQSDEIRRLAGYTIMRRLTRRPGRVNVEVFGQRDKIGKCARDKHAPFALDSEEAGWSP